MCRASYSKPLLLCTGDFGWLFSSSSLYTVSHSLVSTVKLRISMPLSARVIFSIVFLIIQPIHIVSLLVLVFRFLLTFFFPLTISMNHTIGIKSSCYWYWKDFCDFKSIDCFFISAIFSICSAFSFSFYRSFCHCGD